MLSQTPTEFGPLDKIPAYTLLPIPHVHLDPIEMTPEFELVFKHNITEQNGVSLKVH